MVLLLSSTYVSRHTRTRKQGFLGRGLVSRDILPKKRVFPTGFEPTTFRLGGERSILLSYGNTQLVY